MPRKVPGVYDVPEVSSKVGVFDVTIEKYLQHQKSRSHSIVENKKVTKYGIVTVPSKIPWFVVVEESRGVVGAEQCNERRTFNRLKKTTL